MSGREFQRGDQIILSSTAGVDYIHPREIAPFVREIAFHWDARPSGMGVMGGTAHLRWLADIFASAEFVAGPKPEEPTGLGAVVEDRDGTPWVRCENVDREPHWYARNKMRHYADLDVIRVLSEGVTP